MLEEKLQRLKHSNLNLQLRMDEEEEQHKNIIIEKVNEMKMLKRRFFEKSSRTQKFLRHKRREHNEVVFKLNYELNRRNEDIKDLKYKQKAMVNKNQIPNYEEMEQRLHELQDELNCEKKEKNNLLYNLQKELQKWRRE